MGVQHKKDLCENGKDLWATVKRPLCIWFCSWETSISLPVILEREGFQASYFQQGFICYYDEQGSLLGEIGAVNQEHAAESRSEAVPSTWGRLCCWGGGCSEGRECTIFHAGGGKDLRFWFAMRKSKGNFAKFRPGCYFKAHYYFKM